MPAADTVTYLAQLLDLRVGKNGSGRVVGRRQEEHAGLGMGWAWDRQER